MKDELKVFETKFFGGIDFNDMWGLREHPLYMYVDKKRFPYIKIDKVYFEYSQQISSLQGIATYLRKYDWVWNRKY